MPSLPTHRPLPEDIDDPVILKEHIYPVLEGDDYWHRRIKQVLSDSGFVTTRIQREPEHPVWLMWLTRTSFDLAADNQTAAKQIRKLLVKGGIKILRNELSIIDRRKDKLRCAFVLASGAPGVLN
jgi:hypothetical protein